MLRKSACLLLFAMIAIHAAADLRVARPDFLFSPPDCSQGMAQPHHRSDGDLYGTISAIEGPQTRLVSWLGVDVPRSIRINDAAGFLDCDTVLPSANHRQSRLNPLRI
jgi:hypothetical protein